MAASIVQPDSQPASGSSAEAQPVDESTDQPASDVESSPSSRGVPAQVVPRTTNDRGVPSSSAVGEAWLWVGVLIVVTVLGGLGLMWYRRRVLASANTEGVEGFMESMRRMRASGEMSEEEFQAVRRNLVAGMSRSMKDGPASKERERGSR